MRDALVLVLVRVVGIVWRRVKVRAIMVSVLYQ